MSTIRSTRKDINIWSRTQVFNVKFNEIWRKKYIDQIWSKYQSMMQPTRSTDEAERQQRNWQNIEKGTDRCSTAQFYELSKFTNVFWKIVWCNVFRYWYCKIIPVWSKQSLMYQTMGLLPTLRITVNPIWWLLLHNFFDESLNQTFYTFYKDWMVLLVWFWDLEDDIAHVILNHNWWDVQVLLTFSKHTFSFDIDKPNLL